MTDRISKLKMITDREHRKRDLIGNKISIVIDLRVYE